MTSTISKFPSSSDICFMSNDLWGIGPKDYWLYVLNPRGVGSYLVWFDHQKDLYINFTYLTAGMYFWHHEHDFVRTEFFAKAVPFSRMASQQHMHYRTFIKSIESYLRLYESSLFDEDKVLTVHDQHGYIGSYRDLLNSDHEFCCDIRYGFRNDEHYDDWHINEGLELIKPSDEICPIEENELKIFNNFLNTSV